MSEAQDHSIAKTQYERYCNARDRGHLEFTEKADQCKRHVRGLQWDDIDLARLQRQRRPALTINKILSTISTVGGEQINNRAETSFRPRGGADPRLAEVMTKVFKQISDNNQLMWKRSDLFMSGLITSRGFLEVYVDYDDSMMGEVRIDVLNPKDVLIDPDADKYDPDTWSEVFISRWMTADEIEVLYGKAKADRLRDRKSSVFDYGFDSIDGVGDRDRYGESNLPYGTEGDDDNVVRNVRVIERQYRKIDRVDHFVDPVTGDMRQVPAGWPAPQVAAYREATGAQITKKVVRRIRWTVTADAEVLQDEWSPFGHFTIVPYFPYFFDGATVGIVENLLSPQQLLNKTTSQELHVLNTSANSGWKVKSGALANMTMEEFQEKSAETGSVFELTDMEGLEKIQPNQVPTGLDRISFKAEEAVKSISGVNDSMQGFDREDVAARAIERKRQAGSTGLAMPLDSLARSDHFLARAVLSLVQRFYTEQRILTITMDETTGQTQDLTVNEPTAEGSILNDLTVGEYSIVITSVPHRETLEDSQFEQAAALREMGVQIPDSVLIEASRLQNKREIILQIQGDQSTPEAQAAAQRQQRLEEAQVAQEEAKAQKTGADAELSGARVGEVQTKTALMANGGQEQGGGEAEMARVQVEAGRSQAELGLKQAELEHKQQIDYMKLSMDREKLDADVNLKSMQMRQDFAEKNATRRAEAATAAQKPRTTQPT